MDSKHDTRTSEQGMEFLQSMRGMYIMAQALQVAIATMKAVKPEYHIEHSNIDDMEFLQETVFNFPLPITSADKEEADKAEAEKA